MAANLKKLAEKKEEKKAAKAGPSFDLKWVLAGLGLMAITMGSVIVGIQLAPNKLLVHEKESVKYVEKIVKPGPTRPVLSSQVVNLKGGRYLRFSVALQFEANEKLWPAGGGGSGGHGAAKPVDPVLPFEPMIKDLIVMKTSKYTAAQLLTVEGKEMLKNDIKASINHELGGDHHDPEHPVPVVYKVFFTDFVIQ